MDRIFAPWRIKYIKAPKTDDCIFCTAFEKEKEIIIDSSEHALIMMNIYPYNPGHVLIAPIRHVAEFEELTTAELNEITVFMQKSIRAIKNAMHPDGFNVGINLGTVAGAGFKDHVHVHIVPRWTGDTHFMPVFSDTKVISEAIEETYKQIKKEYDRL
jgi:ATP adenylyltransferase